MSYRSYKWDRTSWHDDPFGWPAQEADCTAVESIYQKLNPKKTNQALGNILIAFMSSKEITEVLMRKVEEETNPRSKPVLSEINKARAILIFPELEKSFPIEDFSDNTLLALALRDFDRFIGHIDINLLPRKSIKILLNHDNKECIKYVAENMVPERIQEIFTTEMWKILLKRYPSKAKLIDITKIRNQTELRHFILQRPSLLKYSTIDDMKNCVIDGPTWVRIVAQLSQTKRKYVPVGFKEWAERDIFKEMLGGRRFKKFPADWDVGLRDVN